MNFKEWFNQWKIEKRIQESSIYFIRVGDKVKFNGKTAKVVERLKNTFDGKMQFQIELVESGNKISVDESEIVLVHNEKPVDMKNCECGQWSDSSFDNPRFHSDWCPVYRK